MSRMRKTPQNRASTVTGPDVPVANGYERKGRCPNNGLSHGLLVGTMLCLGLTLLGFTGIANASEGSALNGSADANRKATVTGTTEPGSLELSPPSIGRPPSPPEATSDPAIITSTGTRGPRKLSVAPGNQSLLPEDHPAWLSAEPDYESQVHRLTVSSFPSVSQQELDPSLDDPLLSAVYEYLEEQIVDRDVSRGAPRGLRERITTDYIRRNLLPDPDGYTAELQTSSGPMYQKWVRLEITPTQREQLAGWYREAVQLQRVAVTGVTLLAILGLVGLVHLAFRKRRGSVPENPVQANVIPGAAGNSGYGSTSTAVRRKRSSAFSQIVGLFIGMSVTCTVLGGFLLVGFLSYRVTHNVATPTPPPNANSPVTDGEFRVEIDGPREIATERQRQAQETLRRLREQGIIVPPRPPRSASGSAPPASAASDATTASASAGISGAASKAVVGQQSGFEANSTNHAE